MLVVIYNCPIFVKNGGWSFTLLPGGYTQIWFESVENWKKCPRNIFLLLGAVSRPFHPVKVALFEELASLPPSPRPPAKKSKLSDSVQICWATAHGHYWPGISLERDDMKLILNLWWTDNFNKSPQCTCPISHNTPLRTKMCAFLFWMLYVVGYGKRAVCDLWNCSIVTEQNQM